MEDGRASRWGSRAAKKRGGGAGDFWKGVRPAKTNVKGPPDNRRFHRLGRVRSDAEIASNSIDRQRAQADAVDPVVQVINAGIVLVATLERAVMRGGPGRIPVGPRRLFFPHSNDR